MAYFDKAIPPGGEGKITLKLNPKGFQGAIKKTALVQSNDPQQPRLNLTLQGTVKTIIEVRPNNVISFRGLAEEQAEKTVDLVGTEPFHIQNVESTLAEKIVYKLETVEEGKHYQLKIANQLKEGTYSGMIKATTDLQQKPEIIVRVTGSIEGDIAVKPKMVVVGKLSPQQQPRQAKVLIVSNRKKPFQITKLTYDEKFINVSQQPIKDEPAGYSLEITPKMDAIPTGSRQQITLMVETDATPDVKYDVQVHLLNTAEGSPGAPEAAPHQPPVQLKQAPGPGEPPQPGQSLPTKPGRKKP